MDYQFEPGKRAYSYVRFSTTKQELGHSEDRQIDLRDSFIKENGLVLDTSLDLFDAGVSGYRGKNVQEGNLGTFLEAVRNGQIEKGSAFIVENNDRLSRDEPLNVLADVIRPILRAGIVIVILEPRRIFTDESLSQIHEVLGLLLSGHRANEESKEKSRKVSKKWGAKFEAAIEEGIYLTSAAPNWLKVTKGDIKTGEKGTAEIIPEAVEAINLVVDWFIEGLTMDRIAIRLNEMEGVWVPPPKRKTQKVGRWHRTYIKKLLSNPALIGQFTPGGRTKQAEYKNLQPIPDYYPAIVPVEKYAMVQQRFAQTAKTRSKGRGRTTVCLNLFTDLTWCPYCGTSMITSNKGKRTPGTVDGSYLTCDSNRTRVGKDGKPHKCRKGVTAYREFERAIINGCLKLRPEDVLPNANEQVATIKTLQSHVDGLTAKLGANEQAIDNYADTIGSTPSERVREKLVAKMEELEQANDQTKVELVQAESKLRDALTTKRTFVEWQDGLARLWEELDGGNVEIRQKTKLQLSKLIERIEVYSFGDPATAQHLESVIEDHAPDLASSPHYPGFCDYLEHVCETRRGKFYRVHFKGAAKLEELPTDGLNEREARRVKLRNAIYKRAKARGTGIDFAPPESIALHWELLVNNDGETQATRKHGNLETLLAEYFDGRALRHGLYAPRKAVVRQLKKKVAAKKST